MKFLKTFENNTNYKIGDFVKCINVRKKVYDIVQILRFMNTDHTRFVVKALSLENQKFRELTTGITNIERLATQEEINLIINQIKYNI